MPTGLEVKDRTTGKVIMTVTDRAWRKLGAFQTGTTSSNTTGPYVAHLLGLGELWTMVHVLGNVVQMQYTPEIYYDGGSGRLSWTFPADGAVNCQVTYGLR